MTSYQLNFQDERYMLFEGADVISKWGFELPSIIQQIDYETITDVIMHIRYTAKDGGDKLKSPSEASLQTYIKRVEELSQQEGLFAVLDLKHDFPNQRHKAIEIPPAAN